MHGTPLTGRCVARESAASRLVEFIRSVDGGPPDVVLLDIGGVLTPDPWQSLLLTPDDGIADRLGIDRTAIESAAVRLWPEYSLNPRSEGDWWIALGRLVGRSIPQEVIDRAEARLLRPLAGARELLRVAGLHAEVGLITDNTAFWYRKQCERLDLVGGTNPDLRFLSFAEGLAKSSTPRGLFELAAARLSGRSVVVVDDRGDNCARARAVGFGALQIDPLEELEPNA